MQQKVESAAFLKDKKALLFRISVAMWKELKAEIGFEKSGRQD